MHLSQSVEHKWEYLANAIINKLNEMCPLMTFNIKDSDEPWINNNNIIQAIREKHRAYEKAKKSKLDADWEAFKKCRNEAKTLMLNAKEAYIKSELEKHRTDPKKFWQSKAEGVEWRGWVGGGGRPSGGGGGLEGVWLGVVVGLVVGGGGVEGVEWRGCGWGWW